MMNFIREVYPLQRMISSEGLDKDFDIVKKAIPTTIIHEYPTGMQCDDWTVPRAWKAISAYMEDKNGNRIADFEDAVLEQAALLSGAEAIITRNAKDFSNSPVKVLDPKQFLVQIGN